jgi:hypothetical protein
MTFWVWPEPHIFDIYEENAAAPPPETTEQVFAALALLAASVVRDFWVVEERERVFRTTTRPGGIHSPGDPSKPIIVYLPRIKRRGEPPNVRACRDELSQARRSEHDVDLHPRRVARPSPQQLALAKSLGFDLEPGQTLVRAHKRGGKTERVRVYRSRSALQCLYETDDKWNQPGKVDWFAFERGVRRWFEREGFDILSWRPTSRGDGGVDVYAKKGEGLHELRWVAQCRCIRPDKVMYPTVIRDLLGALTKYPAGTRGMVVTTGKFSEGVKREAERNNILLCGGLAVVELASGATPDAR